MARFRRRGEEGRKIVMTKKEIEESGRDDIFPRKVKGGFIAVFKSKK